MSVRIDCCLKTSVQPRAVASERCFLKQVTFAVTVNLVIQPNFTACGPIRE